MKQQLKAAAASPKTLGWGIAINAIGTTAAAVAAIWPTLRAEIPLTGWLIGLAVLTLINTLLHTARERTA